MTAPNLSIGILCYGDRDAYIESTINSCRSLNPMEFIIFCNSTSDSYLRKVEILADKYEITKILKSTVNIGSAGGFAAIIKYYRDYGASEHLLLLDDDAEIVLKKGFYFDAELRGIPCASIFRADRKYMREAVAGVPLDIRYPPLGAALGFDLIYYVRRLFRRFYKSRLSENILLEAPYSGLILSKQVANCVEGPREDFFLYADDTEYTRRIVSRFGPIKLLHSINIVDLDVSWNAGTGSNNFILKLVNSSGKPSVYYSIRNRLYIDKDAIVKEHKLPKVRFIINFIVVYVLVKFLSVFKDMSLELRALKDGFMGRLGILREGL